VGSRARLGVSVGAFADDAGLLERHLAAFPKDVATFADRLGDRLSAERREIYDRLIAAAPRLIARYRSHRNMTLIHGDAHVWNALLPRNPALHDVRLIDWDAWRIDTATDDLAYMIAVHWFPEWRRRYERESLQRYHDALVAGGVRGYSFDALWEDYRLSVLWQIATPMWQANHGIGALDLVESPGVHHGRRPRPRLPGAARLAVSRGAGVAPSRARRARPRASARA
jgi:hypothetical protein